MYQLPSVTKEINKENKTQLPNLQNNSINEIYKNYNKIQSEPKHTLKNNETGSTHSFTHSFNRKGTSPPKKQIWTIWM